MSELESRLEKLLEEMTGYRPFLDDPRREIIHDAMKALREKDEEIARLKAQVEHLGEVVKSMGRDYAALQSTTGGDPRHD